MNNKLRQSNPAKSTIKKQKLKGNASNEGCDLIES